MTPLAVWSFDALNERGLAAIGQVHHPGVVGDVETGIEVEDHPIDLPGRRRRQVDDRRPDLLGGRQVSDPGREVGRSVADLDLSLVGRVDPSGATMLQVTPSLRYSTATCCVRPHKPALLTT